jgi:hypothetical protein
VLFIVWVQSVYERRAEIAESRCAQNEEHACQNVKSDVRAANAGEDIVDLAIWQFLAGLVGIYLIAATLRATRDAVAEANEATEAARQAVRVTEEGSRRQLRAYVVASPVAVEQMDTAEPMRIGVSYKNTGQTPAYNVSFEIRAAYLPLGEEIALAFPDDADVPRIQMTLGNGDAFVAYKDAPITPSPDESAKVRARQAFILVFGMILYEDIYGETRRTKFMHRFNGQPLTSSLHDSHNHAD